MCTIEGDGGDKAIFDVVHVEEMELVPGGVEARMHCPLRVAPPTRNFGPGDWESFGPEKLYSEECEYAGMSVSRREQTR